MHIVCPHCTTSYAVDPANFPEAGRRVRCARCQEVWLAMPQELVSAAMSRQDMEQSGQDSGFGRDADASGDWQESHAPHVESPSISADWTEVEATQPAAGADQNWPSLARHDDVTDARPARSGRLKGLGKSFGSSVAPFLKSANWAKALPGILTLPTACVALGAMVFALIAWRAEVVRVMPQTAAFYKMVGMGVNLRGLAFEDLKISTETVNNKPVLLIEGALIDIARKPVEIPRLRFIVRDANGADIYAWNAVLEQPVLNPGEKAWFKTRLASPPAEGREIAVRFFHKLDIASGGT
jgi:predicted Zn finger-like uncharacterized protein